MLATGATHFDPHQLVLNVLLRVQRLDFHFISLLMESVVCGVR